MKLWLFIGLFIVGVLFAWQLWVTLLIGVKEPEYTVLSQKNGYQIRHYKPYIIAQVMVAGTYSKALSDGFKILANYIFGDNSADIRMPMTAPVFIQKNEKGYAISFVMPFKYTLKNLPKPHDSRVAIKVVPEKTVAAYSFTWYPTAHRVDVQQKKFKSLLERDGIMDFHWLLARYNPPLTLPFLMRNELLVDVNKE